MAVRTLRSERFILFVSYSFELARNALFLVAIGIILHTFVGTLVIIEGSSMEPNLHSGQSVFVSKIGYFMGEPQRGDVVVMKFPGDPFHKKYIKRIIGLPGEHITMRDGSVFINDERLSEAYLPAGTTTTSIKHQEFQIGSDEYVALGDNRALSNDSRIWGILPRQFIIGRAAFSLWPASTLGAIKHTSY
mgnify:CR=1 FL=1